MPSVALPALELPTDFAPGEAPAPFGARLETTLTPELSADLRILAGTHDSDVHTALVAATQVLLHRYSGQDVIVVGAAEAPRGGGLDSTATDHLTPPRPVHASLGDDPSFVELLDQVRESMSASREPSRDTTVSSTPLRVVVAMRDARLPASPVGLLAIDATDARYDLTLVAADTTDGIELTAWYRAALFRAERIERLMQHLGTILGAAVAEPTKRVSAMPLLSDAERAELASWNATAIDLGALSTVVELFEAQAARVPARVAVVASTPLRGSDVATASLTYAELNARANRLARHLQRSGVVAGAPVGLLLPSSVDSIVAMLGIMKAEGAYMPLAVDAPPARLAQQLAESGARLVVTSAGLARRLPGTVTVVPLDSDIATLRPYSGENLPLAVRPRDTAYVLFTSGSTGVPKGVVVTHANIVHYTRAIRPVLGSGDDEPERGPARVYATIGALDADLGYTSVYPALLSGATLHLIGGDGSGGAEWIARRLASHDIDVLKIAPSRLRAVIAGRTGQALAALLPSQALVLGGETLDASLARALLATGRCRVLNHYGPTESTVGALTHEVTAWSLDDAARLGASMVPIGRPLANTHAYVIDAHGQEAPVGVPGELWLGGAGTSAGYLNRPAWTGERFVSFRGQRVYRTGDRARRLADGSIEFLGRADEQVKLHGHRVELSELEAALCTHPSIAAAAVTLRTTADAAELVAFAAPKRVAYEVTYDDPHSNERLVHWLAAQLPTHMLPSRIVLLDALPLLPNGKVDRAALRARAARPR